MGTNNEHDPSSESTIGQTIALDVLNPPRTHAPMMGRTRTARWRTVVLVLVHVLMIAHLIQWVIAGSTISPVEPSESMETIEVGVVNAGAIMFLIALLTTALFGRFFCGWLCHMVALQDLCAYMMTSIGIRPKPFRSRLLVFVPLILGFMMFLWPTTKKLILEPALSAMQIDWPAWIKPVHPIQRWENGLVVEDFWASFPEWYVAVPFLLICGFATVYFLGAKGLCTYACPYGGFFAPIEKLAPVRIRVNDDCHQCGYCTSVCTSNVRVSEEVRDFGMVIDNGCMKTLDCVSACPNDALSLGIGRIALGAKPRSPESAKAAKKKQNRRYDMSWGEEIAAALIFLWYFIATRGMLDQVPMLLAGGLAACGTMMTMVVWWMIRKPNVRVYGFHLKSKNSIRPWGILVGLLMIAFILTSLWAAQARYARWRADMVYVKSTTPTELLLRHEFTPTPEQIEDAQSAAQWLMRADAFSAGGRGWRLNADHRLRLSYFLLVLDRYEDASDALRVVIDEGSPSDNLVYQAGRLMSMSGASQEEVRAMMEDALVKHPLLHTIRGDLAMQTAREEGLIAGERYWEDGTVEDGEPGFYFERMKYYGVSGDQEKMMEHYESAIESARSDRNAAGWMVDIAGLIGRFQYHDQMKGLLEEAIDSPSASPSILLSAAELYNGLQDRDRAKEIVETAILMRGGDAPMVRARAAGVILTRGETDRGREMLIEAANLSEDPFEIVAIGRGMIVGGMNVDDILMVRAGIDQIQRVIDENPSIVILRHDFASYLERAGEGERGATELSRAAEMEPTNALFAARASQMWGRAGDTEKATYWQEEAERRAEALLP